MLAARCKDRRSTEVGAPTASMATIAVVLSALALHLDVNPILRGRIVSSREFVPHALVDALRSDALSLLGDGDIPVPYPCARPSRTLRSGKGESGVLLHPSRSVENPARSGMRV